MDWLNLNQLHTFWVVARLGTLARAGEELGIGAPAISMQLRQLEEAAGAALFLPRGRSRELSETGRYLRGYADEIFALSKELEDGLRGGQRRAPRRLRIGLSESIAKSAAARLLRPALDLEPAVRLIVREGEVIELLDELERHRFDLVLTDQLPAPVSRSRWRTHDLGACDVVLMGTPELVEPLKGRFPGSLNDAPLLLPGPDSVVRRELERWLEERDLHPTVVGEFDDGALMKVFGEFAAGLFPVPVVAERDVRRLYGVRRLGRLDGMVERFFAYSNPRLVPHPGVEAILKESAQRLHD